MNTLQDNSFFDEMKGSTFTFHALTRIWFAAGERIPEQIKKDLAEVQAFIMNPQNRVAVELVFAGPISIYRGFPEVHPDTGLQSIPMHIISMEEYGYSKELDTTIRMTAEWEKPNFGYTYQLVKNLDVPAEARMVMTLKFDGVHGRLAEVLKAGQPTMAKQLIAHIQSFPFTNGNTVFQHVGNEARPIVTTKGAVFGYLAYGIMTPQYQLGPTHKGPPENVTSHLKTDRIKAPNLTGKESDFLLHRV